MAETTTNTENKIPSWIGNPYEGKSTPSDALADYKTALANSKSADANADLAAYKSASKTSTTTSPYGNQLESELADYKQNYAQTYADTGSAYDTALANKQKSIQESTDSAVSQLRSEWDNTVKQYDQEREKTAYSKAQATDNLAAYSQANGDRGGMANKLMSDQTASYDSQMLQLDLDQINLKNEVEQQVAQLISEGKIQEAEAAYEIGIAKMQALNNMKDNYYSTTMNIADTLDNRRLTEYQLEQSEEATKLSNFYTMLQLGIFDEAAAIELGVPADQAKEYADYVNQEAKLNLENAKLQIQSAYKSLNQTGTESTTASLGDIYNSYYSAGITDEAIIKADLMNNGYDKNTAEAIASGYTKWLTSGEDTTIDIYSGIPDSIYKTLYTLGKRDMYSIYDYLTANGYSDTEAEKLATMYSDWYAANKEQLDAVEQSRIDENGNLIDVTSLEFDPDEGLFYWGGKKYNDMTDFKNAVESTYMTDAEWETLKAKLKAYGFNV